MTRALTVEEVNQRLSSRAIRLVGRWKGMGKTNHFTCSLGHRWKTNGCNPLNGHGCPKCATSQKVLTLEEISERLAPQGLSLRGKWRGTSHQNRFVCAVGHTWKTQASGPVILGTGCPRCKADAQLFTVDQIKERLEFQGVCLVGKWKGMSKVNSFRCSFGHDWKAQGQGPVGHGSGCPHCHGTMKETLTLAEIDARLAPRGLSLVGEWKGTLKENRFKCALGHEWETTGVIPVTLGSGCPECWRLRLKNLNARRALR